MCLNIETPNNNNFFDLSQIIFSVFQKLILHSGQIEN